MWARAAFLVWVSVGLGGATSSLSACGAGAGHRCLFVACSDSESLSFTVISAELAETDVTVCRGQDCRRGHLPRGVLVTGGYSDLFTADGHPAGSLSVNTRGVQPGDARITASFGPTDDSPLQVGDTLSVTATDSAGNTVLTRSGSVSSFEPFYPNGNDCDPVGCKVASVDADG